MAKTNREKKTSIKQTRKQKKVQHHPSLHSQYDKYGNGSGNIAAKMLRTLSNDITEPSRSLRYVIELRDNINRI